MPEINTAGAALPTPQQPQQALKIPVSSFNDVLLLKLAREIAMDIMTVPDILKAHSVTEPQWAAISETPLFQQYLRQSLQEWQSAGNTSERVRLKSLAFVEEALPEFFARAHDPKESLAAKTEVLKTVAKFAGVGATVDGGAVSGERMVVTINLGADHKLQIERGVSLQAPRDVTPQGNEDEWPSEDEWDENDFYEVETDTDGDQDA